MAKKRAPEFVPLPQAVSEIQTNRKYDDNATRQIVKDAHQLGDLDLRVRRPDGSTDDRLDRNFWAGAPWWDPDLVFETGQINVEARPRPGSLRRVQPMERCRIVVPRANLNAFLKPSAPLRKPAASDKEIPKFVSDYIKDNPTTASQSGCREKWKTLHGAHRRSELDAEWKKQAEAKGLLRERGQRTQIAKG